MATPAGVSFVQLEGNYVISFRDTSDCLPAFTAVRLDRRRGSLDSGVFLAGSSGGLASSSGDLRASNPGTGGLAGSAAFGGSARDLLSHGEASPPARRQRSGSLGAPHKFVITGIPRKVSTDLIKGRLEDVIPGIERVYRDPDMATKLSHPPVILETRLAYARDAFMLRTDWVPVVQRIIQAASDPASAGEADDVEVRFDIPVAAAGAPAEASGRDDRRKSLVQLSVTCPHGRYRGDNTCQICRHQNRRYTFMADDFLSHASGGSGPIAEGLRRRQQQPSQQPPQQQKAATKAANKAATKSKWAGGSCMACLFRVLHRRAPPRPDSPPPEEQKQQEVPALPAARLQLPPAPVSLDLQRLKGLSKRRYSTYDDVRLNSTDLIGSRSAGADGKVRE